MRENRAKLGDVKELSDRQVVLIPQQKRGREKRAFLTAMQSKRGSARLLGSPGIQTACQRSSMSPRNGPAL